MNLKLLKITGVLALLSLGLLGVSSPALAFEFIPYSHTVLPPPDINQAISFFEQKIRQNPQDSLDRVILAGLYITQARKTGWVNLIDHAEELAKQSLAILPLNNLGAQLALGKVEEERHHFKEAIRIANEVLSVNPNQEAALVSLVTSHLAYGNLDEAHAYANLIIKRDPFLDAFILRSLVNEAQGRDDEAIADLVEGLKNEDLDTIESSAYGRTLLGRLHLNRGRHELAQRYLEEALRILPSSHLALSLMAKLKENQGQLNEAEKLYAAAFRSLKEPLYLINQARVKLQLNDRAGAGPLFAQAEAIIRKEITLTSYGHHNELAQLLLERGEASDLPEALSETETELIVRPNSNSYFLRSWALMQSGQLDDAARAIQKTIDTGKKEAQYFYQAALIQIRLFNPDVAISFCNQALEVDPTFSEARETLRELEAASSRARGSISAITRQGIPVMPSW